MQTCKSGESALEGPALRQAPGKLCNHTRTLVFLVLICIMSQAALFGQAEGPKAIFTVTQDPVENGSIRVEPPLPEDGKVKAGTVLKVTATPAAGYAFDSGYYAQPGMWGKMFYESMTSTFEVLVNRDKAIGASFIEQQALEGFTVKQDIVYAQPGVKRLKYDVFSPDGAKDLPMIVIIHGGGWVANTEDIMRGLARELVRSGEYVVCSMDYRWLGTRDGDQVGNSMANVIEDVFGGLAHIQAHAQAYGGDAARIALTGDSAGGHLSAAASLMPNMIGDRGFGVKKGVYEFKPSYIPPGKTVADVRRGLLMAIKAAAPSYGVFGVQMLGGTMRAQPEAAIKAIAPQENIPSVKGRAVPQYTVRGTEDRLITHPGVQDFVDALEAAGQTVEYVQVEGAGHAFFDWKPDARTKATFARYGVPYAAKMKRFFDRVFNGPGKASE
jgi:acetyl esterase